MKKRVEVSELEELLGRFEKMSFYLDGTNHYSGMTYRIYMHKGNDYILIGDGGRIDNMVSLFDSKKVCPAICLGIGVQILGQRFHEINKTKGTVILCKEDNYDDVEIAKKFQYSCEYKISIILMDKIKQSKYYKSQFYEGERFLILDDSNRVILKNFSPLEIEHIIVNPIFKGKRIIAR